MKSCKNCDYREYFINEYPCNQCVELGLWCRATRPATTAIFDRMQELLKGMQKDLDKMDKLIEESRK
jgi:hypothetical protein